MYKSIIIALGAILSLGAVIALLFVDAPVEKPMSKSEPIIDKKSKVSTPESIIEYKKNSIKKEPIKKSALSTTNPEVKETTIVSQAHTSQYNIIIDDPSNATREKSLSTVSIYGTIAGEKFRLQVPKHTIKAYDESITISIVNRKTGEKQSVSASFLSEVSTQNGTQKESITIADDNLGSLEHTQSNAILPTP